MTVETPSNNEITPYLPFTGTSVKRSLLCVSWLSSPPAATGCVLHRAVPSALGWHFLATLLISSTGFSTGGSGLSALGMSVRVSLSSPFPSWLDWHMCPPRFNSLPSSTSVAPFGSPPKSVFVLAFSGPWFLLNSSSVTLWLTRWPGVKGRCPALLERRRDLWPGRCSSLSPWLPKHDIPAVRLCSRLCSGQLPILEGTPFIGIVFWPDGFEGLTFASTVSPWTYPSRRSCVLVGWILGVAILASPFLATWLTFKGSAFGLAAPLEISTLSLLLTETLASGIGAFTC